MKKNRRDFIKLTSIAGLSLTAGGLMKNYASELNQDDLGELRHWGWQAPPDSSFEAGLFGPVKINVTKK